MACSLELSHEEIDLEDELATAIFRIVQESLTNVVRHAGVARVRVSLRREPAHVTVQIRDDGCGFDPEAVIRKHTFGLLGMRERVLSLGGRFELDSRQGQGTCLTLSFPAGAAR